MTNKVKKKIELCFSSRNSVFLRGTLNETLVALNNGALPGTP